MKTKKLSEETEQNPCELKPHWSNNIFGSLSLSNPFRSISVRCHSHIQFPTRNVQWTFMGGYLNYIYVFLCGNYLANIYCILPSISQLTMPNFFLPNICLQWYQQKNTAYRIQLSACLKSYIGGASWTLDSNMEAANCNTKLTKKFISVAV